MPRRGDHEGTAFLQKQTQRRKYPRWVWRTHLAGVGYIVVAGRKGESKTSVRERLFEKRDAYAGVRSPTKGTLAEWTATWLRLHVKGKAQRTQDYYRDMLGHLSSLGPVPLGKLTPEMLLTALDGIERPATRRKAFEVLRICLNRAVRTGRIRANVCASIDPPAVTPKIVEPPSAADVERILAAVRGQRDEALIVLALATGFRQGELVGLRWRDVEYASGSARDSSGDDAGAGRSAHGSAQVRGTGEGTALVHARGQLNRQREYVGAKRGSERTAALPAVALAVLEAHRQRVTLAQGHRPEPDEYVFRGVDGRPMTGFEAGRRWNAAVKAALGDERKFSQHSARHFVNTKLLEAGMSGPMVRAIIGHRDERMTARYAHATDEGLRMAGDVMNKALGGA